MERKWKRILYSLEFSGMEESGLAALLSAIRKSHELGQEEVGGTLRPHFPEGGEGPQVRNLEFEW